MPPLLSVLLIAVILLVAGLTGIFLLRRRAAARAARIRAANDAKELYETAVALRLGAAASGRLARPGDSDGGDTDVDTPVGSAETIPTTAIVATTRVSEAARSAVPLELSARRRLWRDSAGVLLAASLVVMAVTTFDPGFVSHPGPIVTAAPTQSEVVATAAPAPVGCPARPRRAVPAPSTDS